MGERINAYRPDKEGLTAQSAASRRVVSLALRHGGDSRALDGISRQRAGLTTLLTPERSPIDSIATPTQRSISTGEKNTAPRDPSQTVTLEMFSSDTALCETALASNYVNRGDVAWLAKVGDKERFARSEKGRRTRYLNSHLDTEEEYDSRRARQTAALTAAAQEGINTTVYNTIMKDFGISTREDAQDFFARQVRVANAAIERHADLVHPQGELYPTEAIAKLPTTPGELVALYLSIDTDQKVKHHIRNQLLLGHIAAEVEMRSNGHAEQKLKQVEELLNNELFTNNGETEPVIRIGVFTSDTNELKELSDRAPEKVPDGHHVKSIEMLAQTTKESGIRVVSMMNVKSESGGTLKAVRKAKKETATREHDQVRPDLDIQDAYRGLIVVLGDDAQAYAVLEELFNTMADGESAKYFPDGAPVDVRPDHASKTDEVGKSTRYKRRRLFFEFADMPSPFEVIIQTEKEYLASQLEVGTYNPETGRYNGQAHAPMEVARELPIDTVLFDRAVYTSLPEITPREQPPLRMEEAATALLQLDHFVVGNNKMN